MKRRGFIGAILAAFSVVGLQVKERVSATKPTWLFVREERVGEQGQLASIYGTNEDMKAFLRGHVQSLKNHGLNSWAPEIQLTELEKYPLNTFAVVVAIDVRDNIDESTRLRKAFAHTLKSMGVPYLLITESKQTYFASQFPFGYWANVKDLANVLSQNKGAQS